mmetsp:Transcript_31309/g.56094  ORF Transcript_31309/g.56094 Transcript_31309/m.56094 type:complete len:248 (+) Transcript_31309:96-839(+)
METPPAPRQEFQQIRPKSPSGRSTKKKRGGGGIVSSSSTLGSISQDFSTASTLDNVGPVQAPPPIAGRKPRPGKNNFLRVRSAAGLFSGELADATMTTSLSSLPEDLSKSSSTTPSQIIPVRRQSEVLSSRLNVHRPNRKQRLQSALLFGQSHDMRDRHRTVECTSMDTGLVLDEYDDESGAEDEEGYLSQTDSEGESAECEGIAEGREGEEEGTSSYSTSSYSTSSGGSGSSLGDQGQAAARSSDC